MARAPRPLQALTALQHRLAPRVPMSGLALRAPLIPGIVGTVLDIRCPMRATGSFRSDRRSPSDVSIATAVIGRTRIVNPEPPVRELPATTHFFGS